MNYFANFFSVGAVKVEYRRLAMIHHPDKGGETAVMQEINNQYHKKLKSLDGQETFDEQKRAHTYKYNYDVEQEVIEKFYELHAKNMKNIEIEIVGTWIWISGDTKPSKEILKECGCLWHSKRFMWYWRKFDYKRKFASDSSFEHLKKVYGVYQPAENAQRLN